MEHQRILLCTLLAFILASDYCCSTSDLNNDAQPWSDQFRAFQLQIEQQNRHIADIQTNHRREMAAMRDQHAQDVDKLQAKLDDINNRPCPCSADSVNATFQRQLRLLEGVRLDADNVAFYAELAAHTNDAVATHQTIIYETTIVNVGHGYSHDTGAFTAPVAGVYAFLWTNMAYSSDLITSELAVNSIGYSTMESDARHSPAHDTSTGVVVIQMSRGDVALVRASRPGNVYGYQHSSFAGWLLFPLSS